MYTKKYIIGHISSHILTKRNILQERQHPTILEYIEEPQEQIISYGTSLSHSPKYYNTVGYQLYSKSDNQLTHKILYSQPPRYHTCAQSIIININDLKYAKVISQEELRILFNNNTYLENTHTFNYNESLINLKLNAYKTNKILITDSKETSISEISKHIDNLTIKDKLIYNNISTLNNSHEYAITSTKILMQTKLPQSLQPQTPLQLDIASKYILNVIKEKNFNEYKIMSKPFFLQLI